MVENICIGESDFYKVKNELKIPAVALRRLRVLKIFK